MLVTPRSFDFLILKSPGRHRADHGGDDMVALVEVLGTAHDLKRLGIAIGIHVVASDVDLANPHVIGIGMRLLATRPAQ